MKHGDFYEHFKGKEYFFSFIALPKRELLRSSSVRLVKQVTYHEGDKELNLYVNPDTGTTYIDFDKPCVIYQSEDDYDTDFLYAREIDDFFGYKFKEDGSYVKRFTLKEGK